MMFKRILGALAAIAFSAGLAHAQVPYTFANQSGNVPASQLDADFTYVNNALNLTGNIPFTVLPVLNSGDLLGNATAGSATPTDVTISALLDRAISSTQGSILYRSGSIWTSLSPGTSGQFLQTQGASANPIWASGSTGCSAPCAIGSADITSGSGVPSATLPISSIYMRTDAYGVYFATNGSGTWTQASGLTTIKNAGSNLTTDGRSINFSTGLTASGTSAVTVTTAAVANNSIMGNNTGGSSSPIALTGSQATALLSNLVGDSGSGGTKGLAPAPGAGDAAAGKFLKADATWAVPPGTPVATIYVTISAGAIATQTGTNLTASRSGSGSYALTFNSAASNATYSISCTAQANNHLIACMEDTAGGARSTAGFWVDFHDGSGRLDPTGFSIVVVKNP